MEPFWLLQQSCYRSRRPPPHHPKFPLQTTVLFRSHNSRLSNSSRLVGVDEGNWNLLLQKNVRLSVFPSPAYLCPSALCWTFALFCTVCFGKRRLGNAAQLLGADSLALLAGLQCLLLLRPPVPNCHIQDVTEGFYPAISLLSQLFF